jgi:flagellar biosynthesis protein FlhG
MPAMQPESRSGNEPGRLTEAEPRPMAEGETGRLIAIASGKGGVGKTWFAITLAHALSRIGARVLLFDGDLGLANVDVQLGLTPALDLSSVLAGRATMAEAMLRHPQGGFDILAGRSGSGALSAMGDALLDRLLHLLREQTRFYDHVILDLGAGVERPLRRMVAAADTLLAVATEEPTSLTDAYALLKLTWADTPAGDTRVVVNQAGTRSAGERTYATLRRACCTFLHQEPPLAGVVRRDEKVRDAIRRQSLLLVRHPSCPAGSDVEAIAASLVAGLERGRRS